MNTSTSSPQPQAPSPLFIVGLTGGIASGKTTVANLFEALGVTLIDTDQLARDVVEPGTPALQQIVAAFGPEILDADGRMNRRRMRDRVFANPAERRLLESITHPAIRAEQLRRSLTATGPYQMHVIPLLAESGNRSAFDRVLVVDCPTEVQLRRLMERDQSSAEQAGQILAAQATREQRLLVADEVIRNDGNIDNLRPQVQTLHERYLALAALKRSSPTTNS